MLGVDVKEYVLPEFNQKEILRYCATKAIDDEFVSILQSCQTEAQEVVFGRVCYTILHLSINESVCDFGAFSL